MTPDAPRRKPSLRLPGHDYAAPGAYFVTLVTHQRADLFGEVVGGDVALSQYGRIAADQWMRSCQIRAEIELFADEMVVMPNHLHAVVWINAPYVVGATGRSPLPVGDVNKPGPRPKSLGAMIAGYKSAVTTAINALRRTPGMPVWQRSYHDRIIRNDCELNAVRAYIIDNPRAWADDRDNPARGALPGM